MYDKEYASLVRAEKKAARVLKANGYREIRLPSCCKNCRHGEIFDPYEHDDYGCQLAGDDHWNTGKVSPYGLCGKYEPRNPK